MNRSTAFLRKCSFVAMLAMALPAAFADTSQDAARLPSKPFVYNAQQVQLADLLRDFAGAAGLPVVIADGVSGTVNASFNTTSRNFIELISRSFGLIWYFDGSALYIYPSSRLQSRMFKLTGDLATDPESKLRAFGLLDRRYPIKFVPVGATVLVYASGPPRHIELIEALIAAMNDVEVPPPPEVFRTFALVHASAVDRVVMGVSTPGVVSTLGTLLGQAGVQTNEGAASSRSIPGQAAEATKAFEQQVDRLDGGADSRTRRDSSIQSFTRSITQGGAAGASGPSAAASKSPVNGVYAPPTAGRAGKPAPRATLAADEATNTILARGPLEVMDDIAAIIAKLDVAQDMVEVEANIIDVSTDEMEALGFDWRMDRDRRQLQLSPAIETATVSGAIPQGGGFNFTTLLTSAGGSELLARVRALEARGSARVVSQPKVIGAANRTAVLSDTRTASVRVAGNQDARLYSVEAGTTLHVTPRIVPAPAATRISLDLEIQDGTLSGDSVDGVPIAQRTAITTSATLTEGQALLIGGIAVEGSSNGRSGVPWLSSLPWVGALFRFDSKQSSRRQRLFLITPRRVTSSAPAPAEIGATGNKDRAP